MLPSRLNFKSIPNNAPSCLWTHIFVVRIFLSMNRKTTFQPWSRVAVLKSVVFRSLRIPEPFSQLTVGCLVPGSIRESAQWITLFPSWYNPGPCLLSTPNFHSFWVQPGEGLLLCPFQNSL